MQYSTCSSLSIAEQDSKGTIRYKSIDGDASIALNPNGVLFKVTYPLLLPHRKPSWSEGQHNRVRLTYEYVNLSQVFHVSNYPQEWTPALDVAMAAAGREPRPADTEEFAVVLPGQARGEIWNEDSVSPAVSFFQYFGEFVYFHWEPAATFYVSSPGSCTVLVHEDQSLVECTGDFFTHYRKEGSSIKFTAQTVPLGNRNVKYSLSEIVARCKEFQSMPAPARVPEVQDHEEEFLDGVKFENEVEGLGNFIAYNDRSIRVLFNDRTLVRIYHDFTVSAISRNGEAAKFNLENPYGFEQYVPVCVEFYNWAFTSQAEQIRRANETAERENIVGAEISRNERLNYKVSASPQELDGEIAQNLISTKKQLEETRELLNKLNKK